MSDLKAPTYKKTCPRGDATCPRRSGLYGPTAIFSRSDIFKRRWCAEDVGPEGTYKDFPLCQAIACLFSRSTHLRSTTEPETDCTSTNGLVENFISAPHTNRSAGLHSTFVYRRDAVTLPSPSSPAAGLTCQCIDPQHVCVKPIVSCSTLVFDGSPTHA
jgi:hypothetical protein